MRRGIEQIYKLMHDRPYAPGAKMSARGAGVPLDAWLKRPRSMRGVGSVAEWLTSLAKIRLNECAPLRCAVQAKEAGPLRVSKDRVEAHGEATNSGPLSQVQREGGVR